jgi:hypothetical protein
MGTTPTSALVIAINPWKSPSAVALPMECNDSINSRALSTCDSRYMLGVEVKYDIEVRIRSGV